VETIYPDCGHPASAVLQALIPNLLNQAIDRSIVTLSVPLSHYVTEIIWIAVAAGIVGYLSRWLLFRTAYDFEYDLRNLLFEHMSLLSFSFYDRAQTGQLISRANSDIRSIQLYTTFAPMILVQCAVAVVAFGFMLSISVPLALIAMVTMPVLFWIGVRMRKVMFPISWVIQARLADVATTVDESINGVRVIKSFAREGHQVNTLADASEKVAWSYTKDADIRARFTPAIQNLPQISLVLVLIFGGIMVINGHLGIGAILAFNAYLVILQAPFMMLGMLVMMGQRAAASADRIFEILDVEADITDRPGAVDLDVTGGAVEFSGVRFAYGDGPDVLHDFTVSIAAGETVALVGRTGSGKSTAAKLLMRFYDPTEGSVAIDGHDLRYVTVASVRNQVGIVLDEPFLFSATIAENIGYGQPDASREAVIAAATAANAAEFIDKLPQGYDTVVGERGYTLSGGQRQRIAIARTLLVNPPILILDDATSAIDVHIEQSIHEALHELLAKRTTLIIAHRLSTIALADRVALLRDGTVVATGTHESLMASNDEYRSVLAAIESPVEESI
jgi:ATP-binding cassette, subfamily B, bacterial